MKVKFAKISQNKMDVVDYSAYLAYDVIGIAKYTQNTKEVIGMLLEFVTRNFKSFKDEMTFSMIPAQKQSDLKFSILKEKCGKKTRKGLSSAIIYGPNAAGKSNIICAMDVLKRMVEKGHIKNDENDTGANPTAGNLELIPNSRLESAEPVCFSILFTEQGNLFRYELEVDLGEFLEMKHERRILVERLLVDDKELFVRNEDKIVLSNLDAFSNYLMPHFQEGRETLLKIAVGSANRQELFLTQGFRSYISKDLVDRIVLWFKRCFLVYYRSDSCRTVRTPENLQEKVIYIEQYLDVVSRAFGISSNGLGYVVPEDEKEPRLCSMISAKNGKYLVPAEIYESFGTVRFVELFPAIVEALLGGGTLVVDEFDTALHPMALMSLINVFHNDEINKNRAQLIFNTHNPIYLNANLFRRDEIKFVERDDETGISHHYSLSDFGTAGSKGVRKGEDYLGNYFISRYGAIREIDFSIVLEDLITKQSAMRSESKQG